MFRFHRRRKKYISINLATRKKESLLQKIGISFLGQLKGRNLYLGLLSAFSFISIFAVNYYLNSRIEALKDEINKVDYKVRFKTVALHRLKRNLEKADKIFKRLYIPELKEKAFILWYNDKFEKNIWKNVYKFAEIVGNIPSFIGFSVYPNPYVGFDRKFFMPNWREHKVFYQKIDRNYFVQPFNFSNSLAVIINPFNVDKKFLKNVEKIKDSTIKANLLLEYGLLWYGLENLQVEVPAYLVFPINLIFTEEDIYKATLKKLNRFCNYLLISKRYGKYYYLNNKLNVRIVIDGICIKLAH
ncbi:MAG: hypothetical protein DSZ30_00720 [Aquificaceae bacterium]|nr:MAG: hypothetical protein DSZ30_00720 [Aquificaceae bacterium]